MMRRILVDYARWRNAGKRGADFQKFPLDESIDKAVERSSELIAPDEALKQLAEKDEQKSRIIELRYFGGLSVEETAEALGISPPYGQTPLAYGEGLALRSDAKDRGQRHVAGDPYSPAPHLLSFSLFLCPPIAGNN